MIILDKIPDTFQDKNNIYYKLWNELEKNKALPERLRNIVNYNLLEFKDLVISQDKNFAHNLTDSLINGDIIVIKKAFDEDFIFSLKTRITEYVNTNESSFFKITEGVKNFYRNIDEKVANKYSIKAIKKSAYFFPWNKDEFDFFEKINKTWRIIKLVSGYFENCWEDNTPKDGIIDRIQVVNYPPNTGGLELHQDPYLYQKFFINIYLSKKGKDFEEGGIYCIDQNNKKINLEDKLDVGDCSFGFATIYHGVDSPKGGVKNDQYLEGRWFLGLYSMCSDYVKNRHTAKPAKL
ncbi:MAG: hypothetical protein CFH18_00475 [Alphaproteobacteria bacterium MarineAlpha5_Bin8]|nr:MAG: hypothetical protein CFH17_00653 [Alphaproteobacteria bacterium MarineAlpha5_Bin7]PPR47083.1 MAG: hypothetical protein CFH18_00475 [Alphaproteobacteria bacterium MarineAlpha5_Bin8]|tara:strand:+ start:785 stop:1663 length:879 start_codon:yes stop_codon:yes gene_type:complete